MKGVPLFLLLALTIIVSCQKTIIEPSPKIEEKSIANLTIEQVPEVKNALENKLKISSRPGDVFSVGGQGSDSEFKINWDHILEATDSLGNRNYTFGIEDNSDDPLLFYNLVIGKNSDGDFNTPQLLKFYLNEDFLPEFKQTGSMENFRGKISRTFLTNWPGQRNRNQAALENGYTSTKTEVACPEEEASFSGTPSGGGSSGSSGSSGGNCDWYVTEEVYNWKVCDRTGCTYHSEVISTTLSFECKDDPVNEVNDVEPGCEGDNTDIAILPPVEVVPPDCASFNYVKTTDDAFWQESGVEGIHFEVYIIEPGSTRRKYAEIRYNETIYFGMPTKTADGTTIRPGQAAEASANILNFAMSRTAHYFHGTRASKLDVKLYFQRMLKSLMASSLGRANFNDYPGSERIITTPYQVRTWGTGNCD